MKKHAIKAFTLVEMMVAIAITCILIVAIAAFISAVLSNWTTGRDQLRKNMDARAALDLIVQDLDNVVISPSPLRPAQEWICKDVDPAIGGGAYTATNVAKLMFFSTPLDQTPNLSGNVCGVAYCLGYEDPILTNSSNSIKLFGLYRTRISPSDTFVNLIGATNLETSYWTNVNMLASTNFLIPHVIDFRIICHVRNPDNSLADVPYDSLVTLGDGLQVSPSQSNILAGAYLESMDVSIKLITEDIASDIRHSPANANELISLKSQTYMRHIALSYLH